MKQTLVRKMATEFSKYWKLSNKERTADAQAKLIKSIQQTDKILKELIEEEKLPELPFDKKNEGSKK